MKRHRCLVVALLAMLFSSAMSAQLTADVTLEGQSGSQATFVTLITGQKTKDAEKDAIEATFDVLLSEGVEGLHNGQPMVNNITAGFRSRFFGQGLYNRFLVGKPVRVSQQKVNGVRQVTMRVTVNMKGLLREVSGSATLSPAWTTAANSETGTSAGNGRGNSGVPQPSVVVVPYVKGNGDDGYATMKALIDCSPAHSQLVNDLSAMFAREGYKTRDLRAFLRNAKTSNLLNEGAQDDTRSLVARNLPGDIVVSVELNVKTEGRRGSCSLNVNAVENQTGLALGGASFNSGQLASTDTTVMAGYALKKVQKQFFTDIKNAFDKMVADGRTMSMELNLGQSVADWDFDQPTPITNDDFKMLLEDWLAQNSFNGVYDMGVSSDKFVQINVNIPLWDHARNRAYSTSMFGNNFKRFLRENIGDEYKATVTFLGQKIHVVIE